MLVASHPVAWPLRRAWLHPPDMSLQILIEVDEVPPQSSLLKAEQAQLSQPFLMREMFQSPHHLSHPPLDLLQELIVSLFLRSQDLDTALWVKPHYISAEEED
ncbi:hypothetical protein DUI87_08794 [Hirundo rustica rustica]|uniref:Uncharacterized protein n=1 Tax=Hirundo rustica rustica TaxID=333673 RepID=A0A3M0KKW6_HIRRU|nr:hypothetical protein DUI87_08794 [Hirundo rustica rustica]